MAALLIGLFINGTLFARSLRALEQRDLERLQKTVGTLVEHARRAGDDLTMQEAMYALSQAPGIPFACVVDQNKIILAHNDPSQLGRAFRRPRIPFAVYALREGAERWGSLVLPQRDPFLKKWLNSQLIFWMLEAGAASLALAAWLVHGAKKTAALRQDLSDAARRAEEDRANFKKESERHARLRLCWMAWLQSAVDQIERPALFLDASQRTVAYNRSAARAMGFSSLEEAVGKSWQEIAALGGLGKTLQQSLESPGKAVEPPAGSLPFQFVTLQDALHSILGTWISFR